MLEKAFLTKWLTKIPPFFSHIYVLFLVLISFVIFHADGMSAALHYLQGMFGGLPATNALSLYYLKSYAVILAVAAFCATPVLKNLLAKIMSARRLTKAMAVLEPAFCVAVLLLVTGYLLDASFNPFLYFRF